jgi:hypothetical protein
MPKYTSLGLVVQTHTEPEISCRLGRRINSIDYSVREVPIIRSSLELYFNFYIDVLLVEIVKNNSKLLALESNGAIVIQQTPG